MTDSYSFKTGNVEMANVIDFVAKCLTDRKYNKTQVKETALVTEEVLLKIHQSVEKGTKMVVKVQDNIGGSSVHFLFKGEAFELFDAEDDIADRILKQYENKLSIRYKNGRNDVTIIGLQPFGKITVLSLIAMLLGILTGLILKRFDTFAIAEFWVQYVIWPIETLFVDSLGLMSTPITFFSIIALMSRYNNNISGNRVLKKSLVKYAITSLLAVTIGMITCLAVNEVIALPDIKSGIAKVVESRFATTSAKEFLYNLAPEHVFEPFINYDVIKLIVLSVLFGIGVIRMGEYSDIIKDIVYAVSALLNKMLAIVYNLLPIAVFVSFQAMVLLEGGAFVARIMLFFIVSMAIAVSAMALIYSIDLINNNINPVKFINTYRKSLLETFRIGSSLDAVPLTIRSCRRLFKIPNVFLEKVIPMGAAINMDGSCIYLGIMTIMLVLMTGIQPNLTQYFVIGAIIVLMSVGAPNQSGGGIVGIAVLLPFLGLSNDMIMVIILFEFIAGSFFACSNTVGDVVAAVVAAERFGIMNEKSIKFVSQDEE